MGLPSRPLVQHQGPACHCVLDGKCLGWLSCTCYAFAMAIDKATLGVKRPSGCKVRDLIVPRDTTGGTMQTQCKDAADYYGVKVEVRNGSNVCTPDYAAGQLYRGRGFVLGGNAGALLGTTWQSTGGYVNHAVYVNEGRGWYKTSTGLWRPKEVLVYDPAADGSRAGKSPEWWTWAILLKFARLLRPWGDNDSRILGDGKFYATLFPDTEPHVHLRYSGSVRTSPFPRVYVFKSPTAGRKVNVRSGPSTSYGVVSSKADGERFAAYQQNPNGQLLAGSRLWIGDHNGRLWVHSSGLRPA